MSDTSRLSHVARIATCSGLISEIKSNPNLAADAGLPETEIARLETLLAEYKMQYVQPREQKVGSTVVTKELQNTFIIADKILKFETDKLAILFIDDYPGFYLTYRNARKIEDLGIRHMSTPKMSSDEEARPEP